MFEIIYRECLSYCRKQVLATYFRKHAALLIILVNLFLNDVVLADSGIGVQAELIQRGEFLNGYGKPVGSNTEYAAFIGQRARLKFNYQSERMRFYVALQDIRTWGSSTPNKLTDGFLSVHEAWTELSIGDRLKLKFGRQELNYDDGRFLGNADWALQARAHDLAAFQYTKEEFALHGGFAFNQEKQNQLQGNFYSISGQYKVAQYLWLNHSINRLKFGFLFWNDGEQYLSIDTDSTRHEKVVYSQTFGLPIIGYSAGVWKISGFAYYQTGKTANNKALDAFDLGGEVIYQLKHERVSTTPCKLKFILGTEILSGNSQFSTSKNCSNAYNPMFGTNHKFNGYMDYFYVGGRHVNSVGLWDSYLKGVIEYSPSGFVGLSVHRFLAAEDVRNPQAGHMDEKMDRYLGMESDLTLGFIVNNEFSLQGGYSIFLAEDAMKALSGDMNASTSNHWAYIMILVRPGNKVKFTGLRM